VRGLCEYGLFIDDGVGCSSVHIYPQRRDTFAHTSFIHSFIHSFIDPLLCVQVWRFSDNAFVIDPTNDVGKVDAVCVGGRDGLPGSQWLFRNVFRMSVPTTLCRINEPPLGRDVNVVTEEDRDRRCVAFLLERDVIAGEEFFIDYGLSYDRSMYSKK